MITQGSIRAGFEIHRSAEAGLKNGYMNANFPFGSTKMQPVTSQCTWVTKLVGSNFQLVPGADPLCGQLIPGVTVGSP